MKQPLASRMEKTLIYLKKGMSYFAMLIVLLILTTGIFRVQSDEVAIKLRFGKLVGDSPATQILQPGLHFAFPSVIDEIIYVPVAKVQELIVDTHTSVQGNVTFDVRSGGYVLTGDHNMVLMQATVKYRISNPVEYVLYHKQGEQIINDIVSGRLFAISAEMSVDELLTTGKTILMGRTMQETQAIADEMKLGVTITGVELTKIGPPAMLEDAFQAVNDATVQKKTLLEQANEYRERVVPEAQAKAQEYIDNAKTNRDTTIAEVHKQIASFNGLLTQYEKSPESVISTAIHPQIIQIMQKMNVILMVDDKKPASVILP